MSRRRETQKRDQRGRGGRSAPAGGGAPGHRRHPASSHQTSVTSDLREWLGPRGVPSHTSEPRCPCYRSLHAAGSVFPTPHFLASLSPPSVPAPRAGSRCWTLSLPLVGDARPTKRPGSRRRPLARSLRMLKRWGLVGLVRLRGAVGRCH